MANLSNVTYTGNGATTTFVVPFGFLEESDITVTVDDIEVVNYSFNVSNDIVFDSAPSNGAVIYISRDSDVTQRVTTFVDGSGLTEDSLNDGGDQSLYLHQETRDLIDTINADNASVLSRVEANETGVSTNAEDIATNASAIADKANGAASSTDNAIARFDSTTGKVLQNSVVTIDDAGAVSGVDTINGNSLPETAGTLATTEDTVEGAVDQVVTVQVDEAGGVSKGQVVTFQSVTGQKIQAQLASNTNDSDIKLLGIAREDGDNNDNIEVVTSGLITNFDTSAFSEGDVVYLGSTDGSLTATRPTGNVPVVKVGIVLRSHINQGQIYIRIERLTDVVDYAGDARRMIKNISSDPSAFASFSAINDQGRRASFNITSSNNVDNPSGTYVYTQGYGNMINYIDGNKDFIWSTDTTDSHTNSATEKMRLKADGELQVSSVTVNSTVEVDGVLDEDDMVSNSATKLATQQSIKSYADTKVSSEEPQVEAAISLKEESSTPSTPSSGYKKFYAKDDGKMYTLDDAGNEIEVGSGAGGGSINYLSGDNGDFETSIGDWTADGANLTVARQSSTVLRGSQSLQITKPLVNSDSARVRVPFTVDNADLAKMLMISFDYDASHANYTDDRLRIFIRDTTNGVDISVNGESIKSGKGTHLARFQTASDSNDYELVFEHTDSTVDIYTFFADNFSISPVKITYGAVVTDWTAYTPNSTWASNTTHTAFYKRSGDTIEVNGKISFDGAPDNTVLEIDLPSGLLIDTAKLAESTTYYTVLGEGTANDNGTSQYSLRVVYGDTDHVRFVIHRDDTGSAANYINYLGITNNTRPHTWASGDTLSYSFNVPIRGWSSNARMSEDLGGREIVADIEQSSAQSIPNNSFTSLSLDSVNIDTTGSHDSVNDKYVIPENGNYTVSASFAISGATGSTGMIIIRVNLNGSEYYALRKNIPATSVPDNILTIPMYGLSKGDEITLDGYHSNGASLNTIPEKTKLYVAKLASPQTILENETVAARYVSNSGQNIPSGTNTTHIYEDLIKDTHGSYNTSTGEYTVPVSGWYSAQAKLQYDNTSFSVGTTVEISFEANGSDLDVVNYEINNSNTTRPSVAVVTHIYLEKGDVLKVNTFQNEGSDRSIRVNASRNVFSIARIK